MAYTKTDWVSGGAPALNATNLDHLEEQYDDAVAETATLITAIPEDAAAGIASQRTLGAGAQQAAAGNHSH